MRKIACTHPLLFTKAEDRGEKKTLYKLGPNNELEETGFKLSQGKLHMGEKYAELSRYSELHVNDADGIGYVFTAEAQEELLRSAGPKCNKIVSLETLSHIITATEHHIRIDGLTIDKAEWDDVRGAVEQLL